MKNWIKDRLDFMDFKSFLWIVIILTIIIFGFNQLYNFRDQFRQRDIENFKGNTTGQIISIEPIVRNRQTKWRGTEIYTDSYKIQYNYTINGQSFEKTDFIQLNTKNKKFLKMVLDRDSTDTFEIHYDLADPEKSILATVD